MDSYTFPENLDKINAAFRMTAVEFDMGEYSKQSGQRPPLKNIQAVCTLPIPKSGLIMQDSSKTIEGSAAGSVSDTGQQLWINALKGYLSGFKVDQFVQRNVYLNSRKNILYRGVALRSFIMEWDFIPENKDDAERLKNLIKTLRRYSLPALYENINVIEKPCLWLVEPLVQGKEVQKYDYMFIEELIYSHDQNGQTMFFTDGKPVKTNLKIKFKELRISGSERVDWEKVGEKYYLPYEKDMGIPYRNTSPYSGNSTGFIGGGGKFGGGGANN